MKMDLKLSKKFLLHVSTESHTYNTEGKVFNPYLTSISWISYIGEIAYETRDKIVKLNNTYSFIRETIARNTCLILLPLPPARQHCASARQPVRL